MCVCVLCRINNLDGSAAGEDTNLARIIGGSIRERSKHEKEMSVRMYWRERSHHAEEERMFFSLQHIHMMIKHDPLLVFGLASHMWCCCLCGVVNPAHHRPQLKLPSGYINPRETTEHSDPHGRSTLSLFHTRTHTYIRIDTHKMAK